MVKQELTNNRSILVGTTSVLVSEECFQQRTAIIVTNTSTAGQKISIGISQEAVNGTGIVLSPGGTFQDSRDGKYLPSNQQINAISDAAGGSIAVHERIDMEIARF